jgi:hypothetical protein
MTHPFHFILDSFSLFALKQPQMQIGSDIDLNCEHIVGIDPQQL